MIPAALHTRVSSAALGINDVPRKDVLAQVVRPPRRSNTNDSAPPAAAVSAKLVQPQPDPPRLVRTSFDDSGNSVTELNSVFLVMHTEQVDDSGRMVWSISVWRLTVFHPVDRLQKGITPKST